MLYSFNMTEHWFDKAIKLVDAASDSVFSIFLLLASFLGLVILIGDCFK